MTAEQQRIAIAEACGWSEVKCESNYFIGRSTPKSTLRGNSPKGNWKDIPNYLNNLNACHEFEKILDKMTGIHGPSVGICTGNEVYEDMLLGMCDHPIRATATQRCEAFLKTIGKWTND